MVIMESALGPRAPAPLVDQTRLRERKSFEKDVDLVVKYILHARPPAFDHKLIFIHATRTLPFRD